MTIVTPSSETTSAAIGGTFAFDHPHEASHTELVALLGGKGAGLAEMSTTLGIDVPPGFTISIPVCKTYLAEGWPDGLDDVIAAHVAELGARMGRHLGDHTDPLLVAVRSGAPVSMPGMLDTVLNLGLNDETVQGLAASSGSVEFAWDSYRRFLAMYATTVMGIDGEALKKAVGHTVSPQQHVDALKSAIRGIAGRDVPSDPAEQLRNAVEAVFRSWNSARAKAYRDRESIDPDLGTAVTVQAMVFGNRGNTSGTGVVFTRNPSTGHNELYGDYLPGAQGEDVVAGTARTLHVADLERLDPRVYEQLRSTLRRLEIHFRDMCDVEFTVEEGKLWLLQTRAGKRGACAAVRIAVALSDDADIALTPAEVLARVPAAVRARAREEAVAHIGDESTAGRVMTKALGASPGRAVGRAVFSSDAAADSEDDVILIRTETSPEDVAGMAASAGLLTTKGGLVSHAAVVARGWGIPAVVGAHELQCTAKGLLTPDGDLIGEGEMLTIDGTTGCVWLGDVGAPSKDEVCKAIEHELPELIRLEQWAATTDEGKEH